MLTRTCGVCSRSGFGLVVLWVFAPLAFVLIAGWSDFAVCLGVLAFKSSELVADIAYGERQLRQDYVRLALSLGCRGLVALGVFVVAALSELPLEVALLLQAASSWGMVVGFDVRPLVVRMRSVRSRVQSGALLGVFRRTLPLALATLGLSISQHGPRLVVGWLDGVESLGRVAPVLVGVAAWAFLTQTLGGSAPRLASGSRHVQHWVDFGLRHALSLAAITGTLGSLGGYLVSEIVLEPFVSDEAPSGTFVVTAFLAFGPLSVTALARARAISAGAYSVVAAAGWSGAVVAAAVSGGLLHSIGVFAAAVALVARPRCRRQFSFRARSGEWKLMKIGLLIETSSGGSGKHLADLAAGLTGNGHCVHVLYSPLRSSHEFREALAESGASVASRP